MGNHKKGHFVFLAPVLKKFKNLASSGCIKISSGLVSENERWLLDYGAGNCNALLLTS